MSVLTRGRRRTSGRKGEKQGTEGNGVAISVNWCYSPNVAGKNETKNEAGNKKCVKF
jgi:hypothetical protein